MTFNELCFSKQNFFKDISVKASKEILKGNTPIYRSKSMFEDEILLTEHFDETLHIALSTDSMARMSKAESSMFLDFIKYQDYLDTGKLPNWMELFSSDLFINIFSSKSEEYKNSKKD